VETDEACVEASANGGVCVCGEEDLAEDRRDAPTRWW